MTSVPPNVHSSLEKTAVAPFDFTQAKGYRTPKVPRARNKPKLASADLFSFFLAAPCLCGKRLFGAANARRSPQIRRPATPAPQPPCALG
jgi:hypothetical protein